MGCSLLHDEKIFSIRGPQGDSGSYEHLFCLCLTAFLPLCFLQTQLEKLNACAGTWAQHSESVSFGVTCGHLKGRRKERKILGACCKTATISKLEALPLADFLFTVIH